MPTVDNANLTLTTVEDDVTMRVTFHVHFTPFERQLAGLGMTYRSHVDVIGIDPPGSTTGTVIIDPADGFSPFQHFTLPVTVGTTELRLDRDHSVTVDRSLLNEDTGDGDELRCRIQIHADGMPPALTEPVFSDQETLRG